MSIDFTRPIAYLEDSDFNKKGKLINKSIPKNIPVVIMIQASWCGYCQEAKPAFQEFANKNQDKVFCGTIQVDGTRPSERELGKRISSIKKNFSGFPDYVLYISGSVVDKNINGRQISHLEEFAEI
jgi:thiol-disulfide isomerase/thioredoxin